MLRRLKSWIREVEESLYDFEPSGTPENDPLWRIVSKLQNFSTYFPTLVSFNDDIEGILDKWDRDGVLDSDSDTSCSMSESEISLSDPESEQEEEKAPRRLSVKEMLLSCRHVQEDDEGEM